MIASFLFDIDEEKQPSFLCTSGCFSYPHKGHQDFIEDFVFLSKQLHLPVRIFVNSPEYIMKYKHVSEEQIQKLLLIREHFFSSFGVNCEVSDDGLNDCDLKNVYWFTGSEYLERPFKESKLVNDRVIGNIFRMPVHIGSSSLLRDIKQVWNVKILRGES